MRTRSAVPCDSFCSRIPHYHGHRWFAIMTHRSRYRALVRSCRNGDSHLTDYTDTITIHHIRTTTLPACCLQTPSLVMRHRRPSDWLLVWQPIIPRVRNLPSGRFQNYWQSGCFAWNKFCTRFRLVTTCERKCVSCLCCESRMSLVWIKTHINAAAIPSGVPMGLTRLAILRIAILHLASIIPTMKVLQNVD